MTHITLCVNCLSQGPVAPVRVGPTGGTQRDPVNQYVTLCIDCANALCEGDFTYLHKHYNSSATITREGG